MAFQTFVILFLSFWIYQEFQNNQYLQSYVNTSLQGTGFIALALTTITGFSAVAAVLFRKLRRANRELEEVLSDETVRQAVTRPSGFLDQRTEQHLVELIRRSDPSRTESSSMPVLRRLDPDEEAKRLATSFLDEKASPSRLQQASSFSNPETMTESGC